MSAEGRLDTTAVSHSWNWTEHVPLLIGAGSSLVVVLRVLAIANFDLQTAYAILKAAGTTTVIIGTLFSTIGMSAMLIVLNLIALWARSRLSGTHFNNAYLYGSVGVAIFLLTLTAPLFTIVLLSLTAPLSYLAKTIGSKTASRKARKLGFELARSATTSGNKTLDDLKRQYDKWVAEEKSKAAKGTSTMLKASLAFSAIMTALATTNTRPWMPLETISVRSAIYTGYVLDVNDSTMTLLREHPRRIDYINVKDQPIARQICMKPDHSRFSFAEKPLAAVILRLNPKYPRCPLMKQIASPVSAPRISSIAVITPQDISRHATTWSAEKSRDARTRWH
ncbi:hypothetical protein OG417_21380 [Actinoallomurus sp. NBC_01490]|uniref:hypothetical protein n=1 Tax=Actinoallomurus sp. NBC_01490 TaxID=2903557 RepID=UPI002E34D486|nr:hypothetical protein [Actinoallomurus sp. NBC_01490]